MSTPPNPIESPPLAGPFAPVRLADTGTEYEQRLLASAQMDAAPLPSAERWTRLLERTRAAQPAPSLQQPAARDAEPLPAQPSRSSVLPPRAAALRSWRPWVTGVIAAGAIGTWAARREPAMAPVEHPRLAAAAAPVAVASEPPLDRGRSGNSDGATPPDQPEPGAASPASRSSVDGARAQPGLGARSVSSARRRAVPPPSFGASEPAVSPSRAPEPRSNLAAEVRAIESIQALIGLGEAKPAASELARYRQRFPGGALALEADVLEVDIALAQGERGRARELARALLERPEARRYRARFEALIDGSNRAASQMNERR